MNTNACQQAIKKKGKTIRKKWVHGLTHNIVKCKKKIRSVWQTTRCTMYTACQKKESNSIHSTVLTGYSKP